MIYKATETLQGTTKTTKYQFLQQIFWRVHPGNPIEKLLQSPSRQSLIESFREAFREPLRASCRESLTEALTESIKEAVRDSLRGLPGETL